MVDSMASGDSVDDLKEALAKVNKELKALKGNLHESNDEYKDKLEKEKAFNKDFYQQGILGKALMSTTRGLNDTFKLTDSNLKNFNKKVTDTANLTFQIFEGKLGSAALGFAEKLGAAGAVFGVAFEGVKYLQKNFDMYKSLNEVGQNFNGSMMEMAMSAAQARLPLEVFGNALKKNSTAVTAIGGPQVFGALQLRIRDNIKQFGQFGMTLEQVSEGFGEYLSASQLEGTLHDRDQAKAFSDLLLETQGLADATGKSRTEILNEINNAKKDISTFGFIGSVPEEMRGQVEKVFESTIGKYASLVGEGGKLLESGLGTALGTGSVAFSEIGKSLNAFAPAIANAFQKQAEAIKNGNESGAEDAFFEQVAEAKKIASDPARMAELNLLADRGNEAAKQTLKVIQSTANITREQYEKGQEEAKKSATFTKLFGNLQDIFARISGAFTEGVYKVIQPAIDAIASFAGEGGGLDQLTGDGSPIQKLGQQFGEFVNEILTPENIKNMKQSFDNVVYYAKMMGSLFMEVAKFTEEFIVTPLKWLIQGFSALNKGLKTFMSPGWASAITVGLALGVTYLIKRVMSEILGLVRGYIGSFFKPKGRFEVMTEVANIHAATIRGGGSGGRGGALDELGDLGGNGHEHSTAHEKGRAPGRRTATGRKGIRGLADRALDFGEHHANQAKDFVKSGPMSMIKKVGLGGLGFGALNAGLGLYSMYSDNAEINERRKAGEITEKEATNEKATAIGGGVGEAAGGVGGALAGGATGAVIGGLLGSFIPILGTAVGAAAGEFIGSGIGGYLGGSAGKSGGGWIGRHLFGASDDNNTTTATPKGPDNSGINPAQDAPDLLEGMTSADIAKLQADATSPLDSSLKGDDLLKAQAHQTELLREILVHMKATAKHTKATAENTDN